MLVFIFEEYEHTCYGIITLNADQIVLKKKKKKATKK